MQRGDVLWFEPDPVTGSEQAGRRPAVVLSRDAINRASPVVVIVPLTTYRGQRLYPSDVLVRAPEGGLSQDSVALGLHIRAVDKRRLGARLGRVDPTTLQQIEQGLLQVLDIQP
jgi:mRNA interferase MazF